MPKPVVVFASKGGNTKKIAQQIAAELGCEALSVSGNASINLDGYDLVFVGTGIYGGTPNQDIQRILQTANINANQTFALFLTWGGAGKTNQLVFAKLKSILESKGAKVLDTTFACYGGWGLLRRGHPNIDEAKAAKEWAKKTLGTQR
jgi:flavodoxin